MTMLWLLSTPHKTRPLCLPQERLQNLWVVYQRLGLEDDIVDPSNELIKEGPIQKISTRNNSTSEKYLFLVGAGLPGARTGSR